MLSDKPGAKVSKMIEKKAFTYKMKVNKCAFRLIKSNKFVTYTSYLVEKDDLCNN